MPGNITIEKLAEMVAKGFEETETSIVALRTDMNRRFNDVETRLTDIDTRLSSVERLLTSSRIERIEDDIRVLKTKIGIA